MLTALIANPVTREPRIKRPPPQRIVREHTLRPPESLQSRKMLNDSINEEEAYLIKMLTMMFVVLVLPALLTLLYIIVTPDAFMIDITPKVDFSNWTLGQRP